MKQYKYIGTEEQLVEHGYDMRGDFACKKTDVEIMYHGELTKDYILVGFSKSENGDIYWDMWDGNTNDITPYIQDLIDDGLVEVLS